MKRDSSVLGVWFCKLPLTVDALACVLLIRLVHLEFLPAVVTCLLSAFSLFTVLVAHGEYSLVHTRQTGVNKKLLYTHDTPYKHERDDQRLRLHRHNPTTNTNYCRIGLVNRLFF